MRHFLANILTYAIAALLFVGAAAFAWMRSSQLMLTTEPAVLAQYEPAEPGFRWQELGRDSYQRNCVNCHRSDGSGWDQYPPLAPIASEAGTDAGRDYLIDLHLYGLTSPRWGAPMPSMAHIHDVELAAVINYIITAFGPQVDEAGATLLTPADIAARRGRDLSPRDVDATRPPLGPPDG
jgi:mono/diheme cytochrome c family protein